MGLFQKIINYFKPRMEPDFLTIEERISDCHGIYDDLYLVSFSFDLTKRLSTNLVSIYATVDEYIANLYKFESCLENGQTIKRSDLSQDIFEINLEQFLVTKDGYYVNSRDGLENFRKSVLDFCIDLRFNQGEKEVFEHNKRMCSNIVDNLISIGLSLQSNI